MGKHRLVPHLIVDGDLDAIDFCERDFGAGKAGVMMATDSKRVLHAGLEVHGGEFKLSGSLLEMLSDMAAHGAASGASVCLHHDFKKPKQVDEAIEQAVKAGATLTMPAQDISWGAATAAGAIHLVISGLFTPT